MHKLFKQFEFIYNTVKANAETKTTPTFGGIWGGDTYTYRGITAILADEGSSKIIKYAGKTVYSNYFNELSFSMCDEQILATLLTLLETPNPDDK